MRTVGIIIFVIIIGTLGFFITAGKEPAEEAGPELLLPSIAPLPAYDIALFEEEGRTLLRFSATHVNRGAGPLEIAASDAGEEDANLGVVQRIFRTNGTYDTKTVGSYLWHAEHEHFHFTDYMSYTLRSVGIPGEEIFFEDKVTYCIRDNDKVVGVTGAVAEPVYLECEPEVQGISVGWSGTYDYSLPGQSFDVSDLPAGDYEIILTFDPLGRIMEANRDDNSASQRIFLDPKEKGVEIIPALNNETDL